jgi:hypothetical protein
VLEPGTGLGGQGVSGRREQLVRAPACVRRRIPGVPVEPVTDEAEQRAGALGERGIGQVVGQCPVAVPPLVVGEGGGELVISGQDLVDRGITLE